MTDRRNHRILIQVTDDEIADETVGGAMTTMQRPNKFGMKTSGTPSYYTRAPNHNYLADIDVLNCTTLSLTKKNHQGIRTNEVMYFDCVGRTDSDPVVRTELSNMFDMLLIDQQNCCLVHFKPLRESPTNFFNNVLVPEVDKRLVILRSTLILQTIKFEYYDVQKYDVVNMFQKNRGMSTGAKSEMIFHNTRELLRWTQRSYNSLWMTGSEHDCFDLEFTFVEAPIEIDGIQMGSKKFKCRLSVLLFYLSKIDGNMRLGLQNFFKNVNHNKSRLKHSIITDYLREYFLSERDSWFIWMLFDVPQVNYGSSLVNDMLALARAAYRDVHNVDRITNNPDLVVDFESSSSETSRISGGGNYAVIEQKLPLTNTNFNPCNMKVPIIKMGNYSLSFWYCRIEEHFLNVIQTMEKYYDRKYHLKVQKMCNDLKHTTRNIDKDISSTNLNIFDSKEINTDETLQLYFKQYREALSAFRLLVQKVERSKYASQLNVFIATKNEEITKQTRQMKVRLLELCHTRLSNAIKDEVKSLSNERNFNGKVISGNETRATKKN